MKRIAALVLALILAMTAVVAFAEETQELRVGTSNIYFTAPASYQKGPMNIEDTNLGQVAYYMSEDDLLDFDLYYWAKATGETLEDAFAEETDAEFAAAEFGGVSFAYYYDEEEIDGETYKTMTYIAEDGEYFVEFVFWLDGDDAEAKAEAIMNTVAAKEDTEGKTGDNLIRLGTSDLYITVEKTYVKGEMLREDTDECQVAYYTTGNEGEMDFDVYYWAKGDGETLESTAADETAEYEAEAADREINGIATKYYTAEEQAEGEDEAYKTLTYIIEDGDYLAELVFWLDGETAEADAEAIIASLNH